MATTVRILLLEDSPMDVELLCEKLKKGGLMFAVEVVDDRQSYVEALRGGGFDVILADYSLPDFDGVAALAIAKEVAPGVPFIFVSGVLGEEFATEALKEGATDYVLKQRLVRLPSAVERALREAKVAAEARETEERMRLLVAELSHRVKNTLATVSSMARLTLRRSSSLEDFDKTFSERLRALADAHTLIFQANWGETDMRRVVERAVEPFRDDRDGFVLSGDRLELAPKPALAITLMLHELATNAVKYGALTREEGRVDVAWTLAGDHVRLDWRERGGPLVSEPSRKGFGHTLIERSTRYELEGEADLRFDPSGLAVSIRFPAAMAA